MLQSKNLSIVVYTEDAERRIEGYCQVRGKRTEKKIEGNVVNHLLLCILFWQAKILIVKVIALPMSHEGLHYLI